MSFLAPAIEIAPFLPMRGIYYIGQYGTSGYANAARGYLYHYYSLGTPITWDPLYFDGSEMEDDDPINVVVKSLINKTIDYDFIIIHSTPDLWPGLLKQKKMDNCGRIVVGYCTWETSQLPDAWVTSINNSVHELWVPSEYNRQAFIASGVTKLIRVVPHIYLPPQTMDRKRININDETVYTFYTIGEMNARKSIAETIETFCRTFTKDDPTRLLVKTHYKDYDTKNRLTCENKVIDILENFPEHAPVLVFADKCSSKQISAIHTVGDCYVALSKSEGFGLPIFDAFHRGKKIITTGYGGQLDFLHGDYPGLVRYTLGPAAGMRNYAGFENETQDHTWAIPDFNHASELMRKNYEEFKGASL